jgi:hypothetical protein
VETIGPAAKPPGKQLADLGRVIAEKVNLRKRSVADGRFQRSRDIAVLAAYFHSGEKLGLLRFRQGFSHATKVGMTNPGDQHSLLRH